MKERKGLLNFIVKALFSIILLASVIYVIENVLILKIINVLSLSTGFVSFFISVYIIKYADDILKDLKIKENKQNVQEYLKVKFYKEFNSNLNSINIFHKSLENNQTKQIIQYKSDILTFLETYQLLLQDKSMGIFELEEYLARLNHKKFNKQITNPGNIVFFRSETLKLKTQVEALFKRIEEDK